MQLNYSLPLKISNKKIILAGVIVLFILGNVFFAVNYFLQKQETEKLQKEIATQQTNVKVLNFSKLFIQKVLKTDKPVSFEDRLQLENAVRNINDPEILSKWEQFTGGTNEAQIQQGVKDLLEALINKILQ